MRPTGLPLRKSRFESWSPAKQISKTSAGFGCRASCACCEIFPSVFNSCQRMSAAPRDRQPSRGLLFCILGAFVSEIGEEFGELKTPRREQPALLQFKKKPSSPPIGCELGLLTAFTRLPMAFCNFFAELRPFVRYRPPMIRHGIGSTGKLWSVLPRGVSQARALTGCPLCRTDDKRAQSGQVLPHRGDLDVDQYGRLAQATTWTKV